MRDGRGGGRGAGGGSRYRRGTKRGKAWSERRETEATETTTTAVSGRRKMTEDLLARKKDNGTRGEVPRGQ